jgi:hypothetical protein
VDCVPPAFPLVLDIIAGQWACCLVWRFS